MDIFAENPWEYSFFNFFSPLNETNIHTLLFILLQTTQIIRNQLRIHLH